MALENLFEKLKTGQPATFDENESKIILASFDVPVVPESVVNQIEDIPPAAEKNRISSGFKGFGHQIVA